MESKCDHPCVLHPISVSPIQPTLPGCSVSGDLALCARPRGDMMCFEGEWASGYRMPSNMVVFPRPLQSG